MSPDRSDQRRRLLVVAAVLVFAAIGLATEMAGDMLPAVDGREKLVWAVLGGLVVIAAVVELAAAVPARARRRQLGRRMRDLSAAELEVHDPVEVPGQRLPEQTAYVRRAHDDRLAAAIQQALGGTSRMVTLVGDSSTGKTRACHEAVQALPKRWRLWHPIAPSRPEAVLGCVAEAKSHTVVWINDAHHYLATADPAAGEQVAAALRTLLADSHRAPVLVVATLWPQFWRQLTTIPPDGRPDPHAQARALLTGTDIAVPTAFAGADLAAARAAAAHDPRLAVAVDQAEAGRITQYLAGVPGLLRRYRTASPVARAVLDAAIDARRLGHPVHLPPAFLRRAALGYLSQADQTALDRQYGQAWFDQVVDDLDQPQHGIPGPLTRVSINDAAALRLADAVEQTGATARVAIYPPGSFWNAAATITDPALLTALATQAERRCRYHRAVQLYRLAANHGDTKALHKLADRWVEAGDHDAAEQLLREAGDRGDTNALLILSRRREWVGDHDAAKRLLREAASRGDIDDSWDLFRLLKDAGDDAAADQLLRKAADRGETFALRRLAHRCREAGDDAAADQLLRQASERGDTDWVWTEVWRRDQAGDHDAAEQLLQETIDLGDLGALRMLADRREKTGDYAAAEQLRQEAVDRGDADALQSLAWRREIAGDHDAVEQLLRKAADRGQTGTVWALVRWRDEAGHHDAAERLLRNAADLGDTRALVELADRRDGAGDYAAAEQLLQEAADRGSGIARVHLVHRRERAGEHAAAEQLLQEAAGRGDTSALLDLAHRRDQAGDHAAAEQLLQEALDRGDTSALLDLAHRRDQAGDHAAAEQLLQEAIDRGDGYALRMLADRRDQVGDHAAAEQLLRFGLTDNGEPADSFEQTDRGEHL
ncbi:tetratricopeptide repeat protein [Kribbella sp. NPDC056345]|uniref:tetratricopeptide repeat protein n=1 Tax=Kribbella sp. NPDC056345 TaxID=3345789 RepID=UPI0035D72F29